MWEKGRDEFWHWGCLGHVQLGQESCSEGGSVCSSLPSCELQAAHPVPSASAASASTGPCRTNRGGSGLGGWGLYMSVNQGEKAKLYFFQTLFYPFPSSSFSPFGLLWRFHGQRDVLAAGCPMASSCSGHLLWPSLLSNHPLPPPASTDSWH